MPLGMGLRVKECNQDLSTVDGWGYPTPCRSMYSSSPRINERYRDFATVTLLAAPLWAPPAEGFWAFLAVEC